MRAREIALPLTAFAAGLAFVLVWGLMQDHAALARAHASAWISALLTLPALAVFLDRAGARPLTQGWRLWWTAGWAMIVVHLWWGLGLLHGWDVASVFERQGIWIAGPIFILEAVWTIDVILAWTRRDWARARGRFLRWQWFAWAVAVANYFVSLVIFRNDAQSLIIGALLTVLLVAVLLRRLARPGGAAA